MEDHQLSKLQQAELDIFKVFLKICKQNNIHYYIAGGSFLGAVRHKGFIPWDDDIDIVVPRPDFEKFIEIAPDLLPDDLYLSTYKNNPEHIVLVAQILNKNKEFTLNNANKIIRTGAWIDLLVLDGAPAPGLKRKVFGIRYLYHRMMNQFAHFDEVVNMNIDRPWYEKMAIKFAQITKIEKYLDPVKVGDAMHKFLKEIPYSSSDYVGSFMGIAKMKEIVPREYYGAGSDYEFEGIIVKGPDLYDEFNTHFYGDYMTPPPENNRNRHNVKENGL